MNAKVADSLNTQLREELFSSYLYLSMAAYFENEGLRGFAHWMEQQAKEELEHAMKIYRFIADRGARIKLLDIEQPKHEWKSPLDAFEDALKHEQYIT